MLRVLVGVLATVIVWTLGVVDCGTPVFANGADGALAGAAALAVSGALAVRGALAGWGAAELPPEPPPPPQAYSRTQSASVNIEKRARVFIVVPSLNIRRSHAGGQGAREPCASAELAQPHAIFDDEIA